MTHRWHRCGWRRWWLAVTLAACGGGGPLGNPDDVSNPDATEGRHLSFTYFQACVQAVLATPQPGPAGSNTCAAGGCHDSLTGTGGALRLDGTAAAVDLTGRRRRSARARCTATSSRPRASA
jgi:hypothetical protein